MLAEGVTATLLLIVRSDALVRGPFVIAFIDCVQLGLLLVGPAIVIILFRHLLLLLQLLALLVFLFVAFRITILIVFVFVVVVRRLLHLAVFDLFHGLVLFGLLLRHEHILLYSRHKSLVFTHLLERFPDVFKEEKLRIVRTQLKELSQILVLSDFRADAFLLEHTEEIACLQESHGE